MKFSRSQTRARNLLFQITTDSNETRLEGLIESHTADDHVGDASIRGGFASSLFFLRVRPLNDDPRAGSRERCLRFLPQCVLEITYRARHPRRALGECGIRAGEIIVQREEGDRMPMVFGEGLPLVGKLLRARTGGAPYHSA